MEVHFSNSILQLCVFYINKNVVLNIKRKWKKPGQVNDVNIIDEVVLEFLNRNILVNFNVPLVVETALISERIDWGIIPNSNLSLIEIDYSIVGLFAL